MKKFLSLLFLAGITFFNTASAQVEVAATSGDPLRNYATLGAAFDAINNGVHQADITITILANTTEPGPAVLHSGDSDPCSYTSVLIIPQGTRTIAGPTTTGRGLVEFNGADNVTIDGGGTLTIRNTAANTVTFTSVIRIAVSANVPTSENILIQNVIIDGNVTGGNASGRTATTDAANASFGIYVGGNGGASPLSAPTALSTDATWFSQPAPSGTTVKGFQANSNQITNVGRGIVFNSSSASVSTGITISGNTIGASGALTTWPFTTPTNTVYMKGITVSGTDAVSISNNTIRNIISYIPGSITTSGLSGIELSGAIGYGAIDITDNTITGVSYNATASANGVADGINIMSSGATYNVARNNISNIYSGAASSVGAASGIRINTDESPGNIINNRISNIFGQNTGGYSAKGINLWLAGNGCLIQNNFIWNLHNHNNSSFANTFNVSGILLNTGNDHKVYHNSVNLYGTPLGGTTTNSYACFSISANTQTGIDVRNNIFQNKVVTGATSGASVCVFLPFTVSSAMNLTLNHNAYFTHASADGGVAFAGATAYAAANLFSAANFIPNQTIPATNFRNFSHQLGQVSNDYASFATTANAPFVSNTDLHITGGPSQVESGGFPGLTAQDIDNQARAAWPDMGADEATLTVSDLTAPLISFVPFTNTCTIGGTRVLSVTITDRAGVPTAGAGLPMLYYRLNGGAWTGIQGVFVSGSTYQFTMPNGGAVGDLIEYYIVAQDALGNVITSPYQGSAGPFTANPPAVTTPPTTLQSFSVQNVLPAGTYTVGAAGNYPTLTAAVNAYNNSCLGGAIIFELIDVAQPGGEVFPISINNNPFASSTNTLTIRPANGVAVNWGAATHPQALIKLNGSDYVTINGQNGTGTWTLRNTNSGTSATVIWISSSSTNTADGATNNTITNMVLKGVTQSQTIACILAGSGVTFGNAASASNNNNTISNNTLTWAQNGIYINGSSGTPDANWSITNNTIGSQAEKMGYRGLSVQRVNNYTISGNTVRFVELTSSSPATGIAIFNTATNGNIFNNLVDSLIQSSTSGGAYGIYLAGSSNAANVNVYNNRVRGVKANGSATLNNNSFGINVTDGGGYNIYYNSVSMTANQTATTGTTAAFRVASGVTTLNVRNNIFSNIQTQTGSRFAIHVGGTSSTFSNINYNDYYSTNFLGYLGSNITTLSAWQAATGNDSKSVNVNPLFVSSTDLHLQNTSPLNALAQPIGSITTDFEGDTRNVTTPDIGADEFVPANCTGTITGGTISASSSSFCVSGSATLSATGFSTGNGMSYQWQYSTTSATGPWFNLTPGGINQTLAPNAVTGTISNTTWYRLVATCSFGGTGNSNVISIDVNNPSVQSVVPGTRCGTGTVDLSATLGAGSVDLNWYDVPTGGVPLGTGTNFTTPTISSTTTYYVSASAGGSVSLNVPSPPVSTSGFHTNTVGWGLRFNVLQQLTINTVDMYPRGSTAGPASIQIIIRDNSDAILYTGPVHNFTVGTTNALEVVPVGITIPAGGPYKMTMVTSGINNILRNISGASFPYSAPGYLDIVSSSNGAAGATSTTTYYWFYNWSISVGCESPRTPVTATVTPAPVITATATPSTICQGQSTTLTASSGNAGYSYSWTPGGAGGSISVSPATTTTYTLNALDVPNGTPNDGCQTSTTVTVNVNDLPGVVDVNPATPSVCAGAGVVLTATGGNVDGSVEFDAGTLNLAIPDNNVNGVSHTLAVAGIPGGATIDSMVVTLNIPNPWVADVAVSLRAPNNQVLNLISGIAGSVAVASADNFTNTRISSDNTKPALLSGTAPYTGTFRASGATSGFQIAFVPTVTTASWPTLWGTVNGNWTLHVYDDEGALVGTLTNWKLKIYYKASATIAWTPAAGLNTTTGTTVTATPSSTTMYYATATNAAGCTRVDSSLVTVNTALLSAVTAVPICPGANATIRVNFTGAGPWNITYTANGGSPVTVNNINTNPYDITVNPTVTTTYQISAASNGSCNITGAALPATAVINVQPQPTVSITPSPAAVCEGGTSTLTASGTAGTYVWSGAGLSSTTGNPVTATPPLVGGNAYSVTVTDANGCTATIGTNVTVNPNLPVSVSVTPSANPVCTGNSVTFTANATNPGTGTPYQWQVNGANQGAPTSSNTFTYTPANGDQVTVIVTSNATCATGSPATSTPVVMSVQAAAAASVTLASSGAICSGNTITFTATPTGGGASPNFEFFVGAASVQNGTSNTYSYIPANGDNVSVIMTSSLACATGSPATSNTITVSFFAAPTTTPTATCTNLMAGNSTTLSANAAAGSGSISTIQWQLGGVDIGGATAATYTTTVAGSYTVVITNTNGCVTTSAPIVINAVTGALPAGTYTINPAAPACNNFTSIANAAAYINQWGITGGAVIFNVPAAYTETALNGGIVIGSATLNASTSAVNSITFQKNGAGVNPLVTAFTPQTGGSGSDAVIKIVGADYITFDAIDVRENPANAAATNMTEFGYGIFYLTTTDGAQNATIRNSVITLNKTNTNTFGVYSTSRHTATSITTADATAATGNNNNLRVYGNTITNVNTGIMVVSPVGFPGTGLDIGGTAIATGNTITDFGTLNSAIASIPANNTAGITAAAQIGVNISYNNITSAAAPAITNTIRGIYVATNGAMVYPGAGSFAHTINNNTISVKTSTGGGAITGIQHEVGNSLFTVSISNNNFADFTNTAATPTGAFTFISNTAANSGQTINANTFTNLSVTTTGTVNFISNTGVLQANGTQSVNNNSIVTGFTKNGGGGTVNFYSGVTSGAGSNATVTHNNNNFSNVTVNGATATTFNGWISPDVNATSKTVSGNIFNSIANNTTGTTNILRANGSVTPGLVFSSNTVSNISFNQAGVFSGIDVPLGNTLLAQVINNTVTNITNAGTGQVNGINVGTWVLATTTGNTVNGLNGNGILIGINGPLGVSATPHVIDQNTVTSLTSGGTGGNVTGIICNPAGTTFSNNNVNGLTSAGASSIISGISTGGNATVNNNTIHSISSSGTTNPFVNGLLIGAGTTNVYKNRIYNLSFTGSFTPSSGAVSGIQFIAASNATVFNNYISDLKATGSGADNTVRGIHMNGTGTVNFYFNTVYLNASGTTNFGASAIFHSGTGTLNLRNSIIVNESVASGTGRVVAYRRSTAISASYAATSNNNVLYAGVPSATNLIFFDGTNSDQTFAAYQTRVGTRDNLSISLKPTFINIAAAPFDLHIKTDANCSLDGGAVPIPGITDDYDNDVRNATTPDIGADEFNGTGTGAGVWKGVNSNWMDVANWCDAVPGPTTNVLIPSGAPFYPIITTTGPMANNLTIQAGASINMSGAGEIVIYGTIANSGTFNALDGTIEMAGSSPQTIAAGTFTGNDVKNFVINNASVTLSGPLDVFGKVSFKGSNRTFATAGNLTLKSTATGTASLGDITNNTTVTGNQVTGDVQIERFASARRAWRFLSVPTMNNLQTIKQAWQENQPANSTALSGLGIHITSERATWAADGFDIQTPNGPSLKTYVPATDTWLGVPTTLAPFTTGEGYMVLVRGDRTVNTFPQAATTTVLRDKGALVQGNFGPIAVGANQFEAIGNPYASAIDFTKLTKAGIQDVFYVWDPSIGTLGAYVTFAGPTYDPVPNTGNFNLNKYIESGSAFFVRGGAGGGSVSFTEPSKVDGSNLVQRINGFEKRLRANMYATVNGERIVHDGIMAEFDNAYANGVDENDAIKFNNSGENLGITRDGRTLAMERRKEVHRDDTIYMKLGQLRAQPYEFEFIPSHLNEPGLKAYLEDLFLGTYTEVSLVQETTVSFTINSDPRSFAPDRFRIVFKRIPPVRFITIKATPHQQHEVKVDWSVEDEVNVANYTVQHSVNGTDFSPIGSLNALNAETSSYNSLHHDPVEGVNYYRIMSTSQDGEHRFSAIAEVIFKAPPVLITLYPNPVGNDKVVNVNLSNMPAGNYTIVVSSVTGQEILRTTLQHGGRTGVYPLRMNGLSAHGTYLVAITGQDRKRSIFKIVY